MVIRVNYCHFSLTGLQSTSVQVDSQRPTDKEVVRVDPSVCDGPWPAYPNCESKMEASELLMKQL